MQPSTTPVRPEPRREISHRWFTVIVVAWIVVLVAAGMWGLARPRATDREQTTVAGAQPFVDQAIARVAAAVGESGVVAVTGFQSVGECGITVVRGGQRYQRGLDVVVLPGTELETMERVAAALPASYRPVVRKVDPKLTADAGDWVLLTATVAAPGEIHVVADTGDCRPLGDLAPAPGDPVVPADAIAPLLGRLNLTQHAATRSSVSCLDGGDLDTIEVRTDVYAGDLSEELRGLPGVTAVVVARPSLFAFRTEHTQVAVRVHETGTIVSATTLCTP